MASGDTKTEQMLNVLANGGDASQFSGCCNTKTQNYILGAIDRVQSVEDEVEELKNNPDVVDIVDTYADLQAYDTQHLTENDIIRVLQDETHSGNSTYYRFTKNPDTWTFIGEISGGGGGDTVYSTKTTSKSASGGAVYIGNLDSNQDEQPDPTITDDHYKYFWALPAINSYIPDSRSINIMGAYSKYNSVVIGCDANNPIGADCVAVGGDATARAQGSVAIGQATYIDNNLTNSVALGKRAVPTRSGEVNIGNSIGGGYDSTNYRVLGGVHDGQLAQDAATVAQVNATIDAINTALSTNIPHIGATS